MADPKVQSEAQTGTTVTEVSEFSALLDREFKPKSDRAQEAVASAVRTLAEQALAQTPIISDDIVVTISAMIAAIDVKLSEQVNGQGYLVLAAYGAHGFFAFARWGKIRGRGLSNTDAFAWPWLVFHSFTTWCSLY